MRAAFDLARGKDEVRRPATRVDWESAPTTLLGARLGPPTFISEYHLRRPKHKAQPNVLYPLLDTLGFMTAPALRPIGLNAPPSEFV